MKQDIALAKLRDEAGAAPPVPYWQTLLGDAEAGAIRSAILSNRLSQGTITAAFEEQFAASIDVPYAVATLNGSVALYLAAAALGIGEGHEVLVPARTFVATAHAMMLTGAEVKLVDCQRKSTLIDETQIEAAITPQTRAIAPVHLNGNGCDMNAINAIARKHGLLVIEDAAQAFYSKMPGGFMGTLSNAGAFSLGVTKLITTGQGGVVVTRDRAVYDRLIRFRNHGVLNTFKTTFERFGFNLKFNDMLASVGCEQLKKLAVKRQRHIAIYRFYEEALAEVSYVRLLPVNTAAGSLPLWIEVMCGQRDRVAEALKRAGIQCRPFLPSLSSSPHLHHRDEDFPNSVRFAQHGLTLPCGPDLPDEAQERTVKELRALNEEIREGPPEL